MDQFERTRILIGEGVDKLADASVILFGVGGVGGGAAEALARAGVGKITLVDDDRVSLTNLNRQIVALHSTVGRLKVEVMAERITDVNPDCVVTTLPTYYDENTADKIDFAQYDYCIDAIDSAKSKVLLAVKCAESGTPIIASMGTGNRLKADFVIADVYSSSVCPLAKVMRKEYKQAGIAKLNVLYSPTALTVTVTKPVGSISYAPNIAGMTIAGFVIQELISSK